MLLMQTKIEWHNLAIVDCVSHVTYRKEIDLVNDVAGTIEPSNDIAKPGEMKTIRRQSSRGQYLLQTGQVKTWLPLLAMPQASAAPDWAHLRRPSHSLLALSISVNFLYPVPTGWGHCSLAKRLHNWILRTTMQRKKMIPRAVAKK